MILLYVCAYIGAALLLLAILILLWLSITVIKDAESCMFLAVADSLPALVVIMAIIGCILLGTSAIAEVHMLGGCV